MGITKQFRTRDLKKVEIVQFDNYYVLLTAYKQRNINDIMGSEVIENF